jgi:carotenoid cleavage dioxygenase-like enzyme
MGINFSGDPTATGFFAPLRFEADVHDCEVEGEIPAQVNGTFYRSCLDRQYPPRFPDDTPYNADGAVDMFRIANGHVDFRTRYVRTPRYMAEHTARRALFGKYRNRFTDEPQVASMSHNTGNTTPIVYDGMLLSMKEDSPPMRLDPHTLATVGEWNFGGQMTAKTFTAHPKIDPRTGEMIAFSYEARGDATADIAVWIFDRSGKLLREIWFKSPVVSMMHDMAITDRHIILPTTGMTTSLERLHAGKIHWAYDKDMPCHVAIIPRDGEARDVRWFRGTPQQAMLLHAINARTEGNRVILDAPVGAGNFHAFFPNLDGSPYGVDSAAQTLRRWTFDLGAPGDTWQEEILFGGLKCTTMVRMDDRYLTRPFRYSYMLMLDRDVPFDRDRGGNLAVRVANAWYRFDHATGRHDRFIAGTTHGLSEPQFVPRSADAPEGDGFLVGVVNDFSAMRSELVIVDAQRLEAGAIARVLLPFRLHTQVHGWWVSAADLPFAA